MKNPTYFQTGSFSTSISEKTLISDFFHDIYFSKRNGLEEKKFVFLEPNKIKERLNKSKHFVIGELGFGAGLNFLATWNILNNFGLKDCVLDYISIEAFPLENLVLKKTHSLFPEVESLSKKLLESLPPLWPGIHKLHFNEGKLCLTLIYGDAIEVLKSSTFLADAWYFDGFNPKTNPKMWSLDLFNEVKRLTNRGGTFSSFSSSSNVKKNIIEAGFELNSIPGYLNKREMIFGSNPHRYGNDVYCNNHKKIIVIGGGIAGASVARALKRRGSEVLLIEKNSCFSNNSSGNLAAIQLPRLGTVNTIMSRLSLSCYRYSRFLSNNLGSSIGDKSIVLSFINREMERQEKILSKGWPLDLVRKIEKDDLKSLNLSNLNLNGIIHDYGGTIMPRVLVKNLVGDDIEVFLDKSVIEISKSTNGWFVKLDDGNKIESDIIVISSGYGIKSLHQSKHLNLQYTPGQVSYLDKKNIKIPLDSNISYGGYITPQIDGKVTIGSTFEKFKSYRTHLYESSHKENFKKIPFILRDKIIKDFSKINYEKLSGNVSMRVSAYDRLPLAGKLENDFYILSGLGSKGMVWAPMMGEALACMILNHPVGLENHMINACDPNRIEKFFLN